MSESDTDFEMLEKRLSDLNPDELILVMEILYIPACINPLYSYFQAMLPASGCQCFLSDAQLAQLV